MDSSSESALPLFGKKNKELHKKVKCWEIRVKGAAQQKCPNVGSAAIKSHSTCRRQNCRARAGGDAKETAKTARANIKKATLRGSKKQESLDRLVDDAKRRFTAKVD